MYTHVNHIMIIKNGCGHLYGDGHLIYIQDPIAAEKAGKPGDEVNGDIHVQV